jgi:Phage tail lysozyme
MALDLKNPGNREIAIFGGGALLLALTYFALSKTTGTAAATSGAGTAGAPGPEATGATPASTGPGLGSTGNIFTDITPAPGTTPAPGQPSPSPAPAQKISQGAHNLLGGITGGEGGVGSSSGPPVSGVPSAAAGVSAGAATVYQALRHAGLTAVQAAGIMGNIVNESGYRVEVSALDTNNAYSYGLVQWNAASHPNARSYVTGNIAHDLATQIASIVGSAKSIGLTSSSPAAAASQWASQFEGCVGCQPGGSQNSQRQANAEAIYKAIQAGLYNPAKPSKPTAKANANFPGGLAAWKAGGWQKYAAKLGVGPKSPGKPKAKAKSGLGAGLGASLSRLTAFITQPPARKPRPPTTGGHGAGHPILR